MIDIIEDNMDVSHGSFFREQLRHFFGNNWIEYKAIQTIQISDPRSAKNVYCTIHLHRLDGPAAIKYDGTCEWWLYGQKINCQTQKQFNSYMKNKAFW